MASPSPNAAVSPVDWVDAAARSAPNHPALVFADGVVTYDQLRALVVSRVASIRGGGDAGTVVPVPVRLDLPSIVEVLALPATGAVPLPYTGVHPRLDGVRAADAVVCVATSGTEGVRRLVPLSMANLAASIDASARRLGTGGSDRWLLVLPIDHIGGLSVLYRSFAAGGTAVVAPFGQHEAVTRATRPTIASVVPTMVHRLVEGDSSVVDAIGAFLVGGGPLRPSLLDRIQAIGGRVATTYGSTETASQVATTDVGDPIPHAGFVGRPLDGFEVTIDADGTISVDGPAVFTGYLGEEPRIGGHRTSDLGRWEDDGSLTVLGRRDDVVITGGENVSLSALEDAIGAVEGCGDAAVVAVADEEWGSVVCALVVSDRPLEAVREGIAEVLVGHQRPRRLAVTDRLPVLGNGKPDRAAIRALFDGQ